MSRRNTTHLSRLARLVSTQGAMPYAKALQLCATASAAGSLTLPLDAHGLAVSAAQIVSRDQRAVLPAPLAPAGTIGWTGAGAPFVVELRALHTHAIVVGEPGSGARDGLRGLVRAMLDAGWSGAVLDAGGGAGELCAWFSREVAGRGQAVSALTSLDDVAESLKVRATMSTPGARERQFVVVHDAHLADRQLVNSALARARAAGITIVLTVPSAGAWDAVGLGGGVPWAVLTQNINVAWVFRQAGADAEAVAASALLYGAAPDAAGALRALPRRVGLMHYSFPELTSVCVTALK